MFINSLQLVAHLVLVRSQIPVTANLLLFKLLGFTRLQTESSFNEELDAFIGNEKNERSRDELSDHELLVACGYQDSLYHNLAPMLLLLLVSLVIWLLIFLKDILF